MVKILKNTNEVSILRETGTKNITSILIEGNLENILFANTFAKDIKAEVVFLQKCNLKKKNCIYENLFKTNLSITEHPTVFIVDKLDNFPCEIDIILSKLLKNQKLKNIWVFISVNKQKERELSSVLTENLQFVA